MIISELKKCRVCISPLLGILTIVIITLFVKGTAGSCTAGVDVVGCISMSCMMLIGSIWSLFIHECAHAVAGQMVGLPAKEITVTLFGAHTFLDHDPLHPKQALIVSAAGPIVNIIAGIIFYSGHVVSLQLNSVSLVCLYLSVFNGVLGIYNLMPVMPLDGGQIVRSILWLLSDNWAWSTQRVLLIGNGFAALFTIGGLMLLFSEFSIMGGFFCILGLSNWQSSKSTYQRMLAVRILNVMTLDSCRKEVMRDAVR